MARPAKSARSTLGLKTNARVSLAVNASNSRRRVQERIKSSDGKIPQLTSEGREERNRLAPSSKLQQIRDKGVGKAGPARRHGPPQVRNTGSVTEVGTDGWF